ATMQFKDALVAHSKLVQDTLKLMTEIGNASQLILDPDIDSYYLMDNVVTKLPLLSSFLTEINAYGLDIANLHFLDTENKAVLNSLAGLTLSNLNLISAGFSYATDVDSDLKTRIQSSVGDFKSGLSDYMSILQQQLLNKQITYTGK